MAVKEAPVVVVCMYWPVLRLKLVCSRWCIDINSHVTSTQSDTAAVYNSYVN